MKHVNIDSSSKLARITVGLVLLTGSLLMSACASTPSDSPELDRLHRQKVERMIDRADSAIDHHVNPVARN